MRITNTQKREIAARMGITDPVFNAYQKREAAKRKALKAMSPEDRAGLLEAEAAERKRIAAESRAARLKRDGITTSAFKEIEHE
jgi:hypothetical protein